MTVSTDPMTDAGAQTRYDLDAWYRAVLQFEEQGFTRAEAHNLAHVWERYWDARSNGALDPTVRQAVPSLA